MRINGYIYRADVFCPDCIVAQLPGDVLSPAASDMDAEQVLDQVAAYVTVDRGDEMSFDSDEFPKVLFSSDASGECCAHCGESL